MAGKFISATKLFRNNEAPRSKLTGYLHRILFYSPQEAVYLPAHPLSAALFDYKISFRKLMKFKSHE